MEAFYLRVARQNIAEDSRLLQDEVSFLARDDTATLDELINLVERVEAFNRFIFELEKESRFPETRCLYVFSGSLISRIENKMNFSSRRKS